LPKTHDSFFFWKNFFDILECFERHTFFHLHKVILPHEANHYKLNNQSPRKLIYLDLIKIVNRLINKTTAFLTRKNKIISFSPFRL